MQERGVLSHNPFDSVRGPREGDSLQKVYISADDIHKVMEYAPDAEWRLIIALWRFGGLRRFSEVLRLKWEHILWDQGKIIVPSSKTERHGKAMRVIPIFHELSEPLRDCFEQATPGDVYIIEKHCPPGVTKSAERKNMAGAKSLTRTFDRIVIRAGLDPWPMPGHNLRASLVTDLYNGKYPDIGVHTIAAWLGHSPKVALKHYGRVKESDFEKARVDPNGGEENTKKRNKNKVARKAHHDLPETGGKDKKTGKRIKNTT